MTRPADWWPLVEAGRDPVPGEPGAVVTLSQGYVGTAQEIELQVSRLKGMAAIEWVGDSGDAFREKTEESGRRLDMARSRYEVTGSALAEWVDPLEAAQQKSLVLRAIAAAAHQELLAQATPEPAPPQDVTPAGAAASAEWSSREQARRSSHAAAVAKLKQAQADLVTLVGELGGVANGLATRIHDAIQHDGVHDSRWQHFKGWVHDNKGWISAVASIASWLATGLAVIALFVPGLNLIVLGLMLLALAGHSLLAMSGDGSWLEAGLDLLAVVLVAVPVIKLVPKALKLGKAAETLAVEGERGAATAAKAAEQVKQGSKAARLLRTGATREIRSAASKELSELHHVPRAAAQAKAGAEAAAGLESELASKTGILERVATNDREIPEVLRNANTILHTSADDAARAAARDARHTARVAAQFTRTGGGLDIVRHGDEVRHWLTGRPKLVPEVEWEPGGEW